ncbi:unnamed protein product [Malus baccata var. baccata]
MIKVSFLSIEKPEIVLISPDGAFTAGFHQVGNNSCCSAIWFSEPSPSDHRQNRTVVWTANINHPVNGKRSKLPVLKTGAYWPDPSRVSWDNVRSTYNNTRTAMLDSLGSFVSSDNSTFESTDYGVRLQRRLRIDIDGNVRLYSRERAGEKWVVSREAISDRCTVHGICGANRVQLRTVLVGNAHGWFQACCLLVIFFPSCLLVFSTRTRLGSTQTHVI